MIQILRRCIVPRINAPTWSVVPGLPQFRPFISSSSRLAADALDSRLPGEKDTYVGEFKMGKRCGMGKLTYFGGGSFVGEFKDGRLWNGEGKLRMPRGKVYDGSLMDGLFHGQGKLTHKDGRYSEGEFKEGNLWNGKEVVHLEDGEVVTRVFTEGKQSSGDILIKHNKFYKRWVEGMVVPRSI